MMRTVAANHTMIQLNSFWSLGGKEKEEKRNKVVDICVWIVYNGSVINQWRKYDFWISWKTVNG